MSYHAQTIFTTPCDPFAKDSSIPPTPGRYYQPQQQQQVQQHHQQPLQSRITPPLTPHSSAENMAYHRPDHDDRVFHNYIRAFYHFQPNSDISSTTVTLPLEQGDIILVHSIHTNGWADGTLLDTGARGWLPTNYCEAYDQSYMRPLLKALTDFWDVMRVGSQTGLEHFQNQDYMRGLISGVRHLLEKSDCLTRDSPLIQSVEGLRRQRKALLAEVSALVKQAKHLQDVANGHEYTDCLEDLLDQMLYKAFRVVTRGVKFLDTWNERICLPRNFGQQYSPVKSAFGAAPLTPPVDSPVFPMNRVDRSFSEGSVGSPDTNPYSSRGSVSTSCSVNDPLGHIPSARGSVSRRISYNSHNLTGAPRNPNLASERLSQAYDVFLGILGPFIGLHLQLRSSMELIQTTQQVLTACKVLVTIIQRICEQDTRSAATFDISIDYLSDRLRELVNVARDAFRPLRNGDNTDDGECDLVFIPSEGKKIMHSATDCVKGAGDCVAKARILLDRTGDFEIEPNQIDESCFASLDINQDRDVEDTYVDVTDTETENEGDTEMAQEKSFVDETPATTQPPNSSPRKASNPQSTRSRMAATLNVFRGFSKEKESSSENPAQANGSSTELSPQSTLVEGKGQTAARLRSNSSASSIKSALKTPASNDHLNASSKPGSSSGDSTQVEDDAEEGILEKTFAHELMWKDGQIIGGTLRALVVKLTAHEATPDAVFVSTIYLTFRSFSDPVTFCKELINRYDLINDTPSIASPVRLRVYNFFKGWLESHWRDDCDREALPLIQDFAQNKLMLHLPTAGKRLSDLCEKVLTMHSPVVPRMLSCIGRTNTSLSNYHSPDTPLPSPIVSRSQSNLLKQWKANGSTNLSVLDFDPTEIARQLTLKLSTVFCSILPEELLNTEWMKKSGSLAVNVRAMSTLATDIANLVADTILCHEEPKKRAAVIKHWIKIAAKCLELNNYDTLMAIICALNSSNIARLKRTWELLSSRTKDSLEKLRRIVDVSRNYAILRRRLQNHVPPCLPFVGTYLTDLTFVDHGNQNMRSLQTENGTIEVINFDKYLKTARIISDFQRFQIPYKLAEVPELQAWIQENVVRVRDLGEQNFHNNYRRSLILEPRPNKDAPSEQQQHSNILSAFEIKEKLDFFSRGQTRKKSVSAAD